VPEPPPTDRRRSENRRDYFSSGQAVAAFSPAVLRDTRNAVDVSVALSEDYLSTQTAVSLVSYGGLNREGGVLSRRHKGRGLLGSAVSLYAEVPVRMDLLRQPFNHELVAYSGGAFEGN